MAGSSDEVQPSKPFYALRRSHLFHTWPYLPSSTAPKSIWVYSCCVYHRNYRSGCSFIFSLSYSDVWIPNPIPLENLANSHTGLRHVNFCYVYPLFLVCLVCPLLWPAEQCLPHYCSSWISSPLTARAKLICVWLPDPPPLSVGHPLIWRSIDWGRNPEVHLGHWRCWWRLKLYWPWSWHAIHTLHIPPPSVAIVPLITGLHRIEVGGFLGWERNLSCAFPSMKSKMASCGAYDVAGW